MNSDLRTVNLTLTAIVQARKMNTFTENNSYIVYKHKFADMRVRIRERKV